MLSEALKKSNLSGETLAIDSDTKIDIIDEALKTAEPSDFNNYIEDLTNITLKDKHRKDGDVFITDSGTFIAETFDRVGGQEGFRTKEGFNFKSDAGETYYITPSTKGYTTPHIKGSPQRPFEIFDTDGVKIISMLAFDNISEVVDFIDFLDSGKGSVSVIGDEKILDTPPSLYTDSIRAYDADRENVDMNEWFYEHYEEYL